MKKICIIIPYMGKEWPDYFPFYCASLANNPLLDVLLFTDIDEVIPNKPGNLIVRKMDLQEFKRLITLKTGLQANFDSARKICDFRPTFGSIFEDYLTGYDFWGYGDIDVIYGNLSKFIRDKILDAHDIITFREEWISGAFTLVRNSDLMNSLYRHSRDYQLILESDRHYAFDECINKYPRLRDREDILTMADEYQCWSYTCYKAQAEGMIKIFAREYVKESLPFNEMLTYANKAVLGSGNKHYALYHLVTHKGYREHHIPRWEKIPDTYYITRTGFYEKLGASYFFTSKFREAEAGIYNFFKRIKDSVVFRTGKLKGSSES